ncbi:hypothetical protein [Thiohalocapsa sp.]|jgi:hypothetical protein|nr:hypothetical protein [Thiohalocapsa sp.]
MKNRNHGFRREPAGQVGLVNDSTCDMPAELRDCFQVHQVPAVTWR